MGILEVHICRTRIDSKSIRRKAAPNHGPEFKLRFYTGPFTQGGSVDDTSNRSGAVLRHLLCNGYVRFASACSKGLWPALGYSKPKPGLGTVLPLSLRLLPTELLGCGLLSQRRRHVLSVSSADASADLQQELAQFLPGRSALSQRPPLHTRRVLARFEPVARCGECNRVLLLPEHDPVGRKAVRDGRSAASHNIPRAGNITSHRIDARRGNTEK